MRAKKLLEMKRKKYAILPLLCKNTVALALALLFSFYFAAADVIVDNNKLNVSNNFYVDSSGKVGIGTTGPNVLLTVGIAQTTTNLFPEATFYTASNKPVVIGDGNNGIMIGYTGNDIQARTGTTYGDNGNLILNQYDRSFSWLQN